VLIDAADQASAFGIQGFQPGVLLPQLLGFSLELFYLLLVLNPALLVLQHPLLEARIPTPTEQRHKLVATKAAVRGMPHC